MIVDIYNEVLTNLQNSLTGVTVLPSYPKGIPVFPLVTFEENSNITNQNTIDSNGEKYNDITFEINIFTNSESRITDSKNILKQVDTIMSGEYKLPRTFGGQTPNFADTDVYKYTLRYSFTIGQDKIIYRR